MSDLFFTYKHVLRNCLLNKIGILFNSFKVPFLEKICCFFFVYKTNFINDNRYFNCAYLFRFFFGKTAFFSKIISFYGFSQSFYSFYIQIFFYERGLFSSIYFLINEVYPCLASSSLKKSFISGYCFLFLVLVLDVNIFLEKKTNPGLFDLKDFLGYKFYVRSDTLEEARFLLSLLKIF